MSVRQLLLLLLLLLSLLTAVAVLRQLVTQPRAMRVPKLTSQAPVHRNLSSWPPPPILSQHLSSFSRVHWPSACGQLPVLLIAILSTPAELDARSLRRRLFCSVGEVSGFEIRCVFVLGSATNASVQRRVDAEAAAKGDILQLSFVDAYRNLTYKSVAILDWTVSGCPCGQFALKTDMDTMVNPYNLVQLLQKQETKAARRLYGGYLIKGAKPYRDWGPQKWRLSRQQFASDTFPPYMSGLGYVIARQAAAEMLNASNSLLPMRMEDVYIGMCASKAGVAPLDFSKSFVWELAGRLSWCFYRLAAVIHRVTPAQMRQMWRQIASPESGKPKC